MENELDVAAPEAADEVVQTEAAEKPAEAPEAAESTETQEPPKVEEPAEDQGPSESQKRAQRRREARDKLMASEADAKAKAEAKEAEAKAAQDALAELVAPEQANFGTYDEYLVAVGNFTASKALRQDQSQRLQAEAQQHYAQVEAARQQAQAEAAQNWQTQIAEAKTRYEDFDQVALSASNPIDSNMANMIVTSDHAADIAYHLGKNPETGQRLAQISASGDMITLARELGRIEATVTAPQPKTVSTAPEPITPVQASAAPVADVEKMTPDEYRAYRMGGGKIGR